MSFEPLYIAAADAVIDGVGSLAPSAAVLAQLRANGGRITQFNLSTCEDGWNTPLPETTLRCACAPMLAIDKAAALFADDQCDAVVVYGKDNLKTKFRNRKDARNRLLEIYGAGKGRILDGYQKLAGEFLAHWQISADDFRRTSEALFDNHQRVWRTAHSEAATVDDKWLAPVTELFRGVDCANPSVDFEGRMVLLPEKTLRAHDFGAPGYSRIIGCAVEQACEDALETTPDIVAYDHLGAAYAGACAQAGIDFGDLYRGGDALLEVYTCYSVVPMGFLLATGQVENFAEIIPFAEKYPLTVTGGLNLAKAPWNNTTLQAFAAVTAALQSPDTPDIAGIHSVGALGYLQAFAVLERIDAA